MKRYLLQNRRLSKIILLIIALASILSITVTCLVLREVIMQHDEEIVKVIASDVFDSLKNELLPPIMVSQTMANDIFLQQNLGANENPAQLVNYLNGVKKPFGYSAAFLASEKSRRYYTSGGLVKDMHDAHDAWYEKFTAKNVKYEFNIDPDESNNEITTIFVNTRIHDTAGNLLGVCGIGVDMNGLQKIIDVNERAYKIKINLIDKKGVVKIDTESQHIENSFLTGVDTFQRSNHFVLKKIGGVYVVTKYIPEFDWYLVIQREGDNMQSAFSNVILYMAVGFLIGLVVLLIFVQLSLKKSSDDLEESAKKHGIASHAGLYVSMHLVDLRKNFIYELSRDTEVQLLVMQDGGGAQAKLENAVQEMTAEENLSEMLAFVNFETLAERLADKHAVQQEFLSRQYGWCKAYFMIVDRSEDGAIHQVELAIELTDEAKRREKHLLYLSETDAMTKLRNRGSGEKTVTDLLERGAEGTLFLLDADKFKSINDNYGHDVGDKVIKAIADCLKLAFRNDDVIFRLGGDEFVAYALGATDVEHGHALANRLFALIDKIEIPELGERKITISVGAALFRASDNLTFSELYKRADSAAYESKKFAGNRCTFFND